MKKITDLLDEFQDQFSTKFHEVKGILGDLGEIKIPLNTDVEPVKKRLYRLNLRYKECGNAKIERMLGVGIIEHGEESKWIIQMVIQDKKTREIQIYVDLRNLNDTSLHDPFPTPFTEEVLEGVGG